jgi:hypothetical protein
MAPEEAGQGPRTGVRPPWILRQRGDKAVRLFFLILALAVAAALGHFGPGLVRATDETEFAFPAPDPDPKYVKPPRPGQSYACDPLAGGNVTENRLAHNAIVWVSQSSASKVAVRVGDDGKQLLLMRATDVSAGVTDPEEFKITSSGSSYLMVEERLILGVALLIIDVRTMKMVWSFNGQGMLGIKGETVLFQCH